MSAEDVPLTLEWSDGWESVEVVLDELLSDVLVLEDSACAGTGCLGAGSVPVKSFSGTVCDARTPRTRCC